MSCVLLDHFKAWLLLVCLLIPNHCSHLAEAQVSAIIDEVEDLLAVESNLEPGAVQPLQHVSSQQPYEIPIEDPPAGFPGLRLAAPGAPLDTLPDHSTLGADGSYSFSYSLADGTRRDEQGLPEGEESYRQFGGWQYVGPDGKIYSVRFVADHNGFRPIGDHLPRQPGQAVARKFKRPADHSPDSESISFEVRQQ